MSVWEPWVPAVGDRVRVRVSEECPARFVAAYLGTDTPATGPHRHFHETDGALGSVREVVEAGAEAIDGHRFRVGFDRPVRIPGIGRLHGVCVAAVELEPARTGPEAAS